MDDAGEGEAREQPVAQRAAVLAYLRASAQVLLHPATLLTHYPRAALRADLLAGATVGIVLLPQALAFSLLAGLPPVMGLYSAILAALVGALWGSSNHLHSGPTNTASILTLSVVLPIAAPGTPEFIAAAGLVAVMAGLMRLVMGFARLGLLINFVSDSVAVGFTAGAGLLIISNQLEPILRINASDGGGLAAILVSVASQLEQTHLPSLLLGGATIITIVLLQQTGRRLPALLIGIVLVAGVAWLLGLATQGVQLLGALPQSLPPLAALPLFDLALIGQLANGALALALIGLVEAVSIARAIAGHSRQRLNINQEFIGQGLANIAAGLFSGYPVSGSFNRSALSYQAGATTRLGNVVSALFVLVAMFALGPLTAQVPRAVLAGALALTAYSMIDARTMRRLWRASPGDATIMLATLVATLLLPLQFAVLLGVLMALGYYLLRTSSPRVQTVLPDAAYRHWLHQPNRPDCPQLGVIEILGDMYFGAVNHIEDRLYEHLQQRPEQRFLLLRMHNVQRCDMSGIRALETILRLCRERGGDLYLVGVR
ncbi:MAG: SulP family inorganic anion transporter, partial [Chloroflexales bacterium]|nr:SulP family inorganic anion transporter [Chloroflexales bacterium]